MTDPTTETARRRPKAFRMGDAASAERPEHTVVVTPQADAFAREAEGLPPDEAAIEAAQAAGMRRRRGFGWAGLFWSALGGLTSLAFGLWVSQLLESLFHRWIGLGWLGVALAALLVLALAALAIRELVGILRQGRVAALHEAIAQARLHDDGITARARLAELAGLYAGRPASARGRRELGDASRDIVDGRDLCDIAERCLMLPLDRRVRAEIATAAKRVSVVTAISPRAVLDLVFVLAQLARLVRRIAEIYSGRPGFFGFLKLARSVGAHLAVTGGMAVGDSLVQQVVGHGIAAKLSARLGEGVLNGLLTTRVGLSAMAVCRPMPFGIDPAPGVKDVAPFLFAGEAETQRGSRT